MTQGDDFLSRWSRRKHAARRGEPEPAPATPAVAPPQAPVGDTAPAEEAQAPLPPVESLTPESDFTPFMRKEVDPGLRRAALRTLFRDPRFNVMDGLDVYIDDFSKPDPIPAEWMGKLAQMAYLGDAAPKTVPAEPAKEAVAEAEAPTIPQENQPVVTAPEPSPERPEVAQSAPGDSIQT